MSPLRDVVAEVPQDVEQVDWTLIEAAGLRIELERARRHLLRQRVEAAAATLELRVIRAERDAALAERDAAWSSLEAGARVDRLAC